MPKVHFLNEVITAEVPVGTTLRDAAMQNNVELYRGMWTDVNCLGNGICGRCRVWLVNAEKSVTNPTLRERFHRVKGSARLSCQVKVIADMEVRTRPIGPTAKLCTDAEPSYRQVAQRRYQEAKEEEAKTAAAAATTATIPEVTPPTESNKQ